MGVKRNRKASCSRDEATDSSPTVQPSDEKSKVHHPHDTFVKCAFRNSEIAIAFFAEHLKNKKLSKAELANFELNPGEHQKTVGASIADDIVYRGKIKGRSYYIVIEHQSSRDSTMPLRFVEYSAALIRQHTAQGHSDRPIILPICLYHDTAASRKKNHGKSVPWGYHPSLAGSSLELEPSSTPSALNLEYNLVDLTTLGDEEIKTHGKAAIIEWILKHAALPNDEFVQQAKKHVRRAGYSSDNPDHSELTKAICRYIIAVYDGDKSKDELIEELCEVMPQGRETMGKLADTLRNEGIQKGIQKGMHMDALQVAERMLSDGVDRKKVKRYTKLPDAELAQLSPDRTESTLPIQEATQGLGLLQQSMASVVAETTTIGQRVDMATSKDFETGEISPVHKKFREL